MRVRTRTPEAPIVYKKADAFTFASYLCLRCGANQRCVSGSRVGMTKAEYVRSINGKVEQTEAMAEGTRLHEEYAVGIPQPKDVGRDLYYEQLMMGNTVILKEAYSCVMLGKRGKVDVLKVRREPSGEYFVTIQENKSHPASRDWYIKWMLQLALYGDVYNHMDMAYVHADAEHWWPAYHPDDPDPVINVQACLHYLDGSRPDEVSWFSRKNKVEEAWMIPWVQLMRKRAKEKFPLHRRGLYLLEHPEVLEDEPDPMFFGRRKLLVRTPPRLPFRDNFE